MGICCIAIILKLVKRPSAAIIKRRKRPMMNDNLKTGIDKIPGKRVSNEYGGRMKKLIIAVVAIVLTIFVGSVVYAVSYSINQQVEINITVDPTTTPPPETPIQSFVYYDTALSNVVNTMYFSYDEGGQGTFTGYVPEEITSINLGSLNLPPQFVVTTTLGPVQGSYRAVTVTASGGEGSMQPYVGNGVFVGS
jgi:hypothetical protein